MKIRYLIDEVAYDENGLIISAKHKGELVRCKDCIHWVNYGCIYENGLRGVTYGSSYCDRGDRREE